MYHHATEGQHAKLTISGNYRSKGQDKCSVTSLIVQVVLSTLDGRSRNRTEVSVSQQISNIIDSNHNRRNYLSDINTRFPTLREAF